MTFTDEELKRVKELLSEKVHAVYEFSQIESLVARLEAAEKLCEKAIELHPHWDEVKEWRRAAGK